MSGSRLRWMGYLLDTDGICQDCEEAGGYATPEAVIGKHELRYADGELSIVEVRLR